MSRRIALAMAFVVATVALGTAAQAAPGSDVVQVNVAGQGTTIYGVLEGLPSLGGSSGYYAGRGPAAEITSYYSSGQYAADQASVAAAAQAFLTSWTKAHCTSVTNCAGKKAAAVFDIDDTLTSSYAALRAHGFTAGPAYDRAIENCTTPAIAPVVSFVNFVKSEGIAFYLITGRPDTARALTAACMRKIGVSGWSRLVMRTPAQLSLTAQQYKSAARAQIQRSGFTIITSIGDQVSDSAGGSTQRGFLLPNPMYYIP